jgi:hypothetical protein
MRGRRWLVRGLSDISPNPRDDEIGAGREAWQRGQP